MRVEPLSLLERFGTSQVANLSVTREDLDACLSYRKHTPFLSSVMRHMKIGYCSYHHWCIEKSNGISIRDKRYWQTNMKRDGVTICEKESFSDYPKSIFIKYLNMNDLYNLYFKFIMADRKMPYHKKEQLPTQSFVEVVDIYKKIEHVWPFDFKVEIGRFIN